MTKNSNGHANGNGLPQFVHTIVTPTGRNPQERKSWSIGIESVWVPFFSATNVMGETDIPDDVLGMPLRLAKSKDGSIRFSNSGRPVMRVAPELNAQIGIARENFVASLQAYTEMVQGEQPDQYKGQVEASQQAAQPLFEKASEDIEQAMKLLYANEAAKNSTMPQADPNSPENIATLSEKSTNGNNSEPNQEPTKKKKRVPAAA